MQLPLPENETVQKLLLGIPFTVIGWGVWVTKRLFGHNTQIALVCQKQDTILELLSEVREDQKKRNGNAS